MNPVRNAIAIAELRDRYALDMDVSSNPIVAARHGLRV